MKHPVTVGPLDAPGWVDGARCQIPVKIIAADGREEYKPEEPARWGGPQEEPTSLPDHYYGTNGDIEAAENKIVDYFSKHASPHE